MRNTVVQDHRTPAHTVGAPPRSDRSLWVRRVVAGAENPLTWTDEHTDEVLWVRRGVLREVAGRWACGPGDAVVVESGVPLALVPDDEADVVWFGSYDDNDWGLLGPPTGPRSAYAIRATDRHSVTAELSDGVTVWTRFWADSTRDTCRAALLEVAGSAGHHAPAHSHSRDELIYVVAGSLRIGQDVLPPDTSIFIPANQRYRFSAEGAYSFINFRRDASTITLRPGSTPMLETAAGLANA